MTKIIDIKKYLKPRLYIVKKEYEDDENREYDKLLASLNAALHSCKESRYRPKFGKAHLRNCRDALTRASFYLDDEIDDREFNDD